MFHLPAEHINLFSEKSGLLFLHPELLEIPQLAASLPFFKEFDISDLNTICQKIFNKRQQPGVAGGYSEAQDALRIPLQLIWKFIIQHQGKIGDISRSQQVEQLSAIKDWPLIPVTLSTGAVGLAPFSHIQMIRNEAPAELIQLSNKSAYAIKLSHDSYIKGNLFEKYLVENSLLLVKSTHVNATQFLFRY